MNMKKTLAGVMAVAMTATMLPGSMFAAPEKVEAKTVTSGLPAAKYEMDLDGDLDVTGDSGVSVATYAKAYSQYSGGAKYVSERDGQVLDTEGAYGIKLENVQLGSTYTISAWVNLQSAVDNSPVISASNPNIQDNWLTLAGGSTTEYKLWTDSNFAEWGGQSELERIPYKRNQWVNYVLSVDGNSAVLYEDGKSVIKGTNAGVEISSENKNITFGVNPWDDAVPDALYDDIKIYDKALSAEQVQALYSGTSLSLSTSQDYVRVGDTIELTADIIGMQDGDTVEWSSNGSASVDENGLVTGSAEGTATITANVMRENDVIATDSIDINVIPEKGNLIAEFTFDEEASKFEGAGAVATKNNSADKNYVKVVNDSTMGNVLQFNNSKGASEGNWLNVTKANGSSLLADVEEFTVSYDSNSSGVFQNCWTFFADNQGGIAAARHYIGIADYPMHLEVEKGTPEGQGLVTGEAFSEWKHIDVVFGSDYTDIYIDGELCISEDNTRFVTELLGNDSFVMIGKSTWGNEYWNGMLDNYKIYDYALTAEEIAATPVSNIEVTAESSTVFAGNTLQLAATVTPDSATDKTVEWTSSNLEVADVNENGLVTTKKAGNVKITATAQDKDGKSGSIDLTVKTALTYHEAKEPTCVEPGNIEYWTDAEGKCYLDAAGKTSTTTEAVGIPATGHSYTSSGKWTKTESGYSLTVTYTCKNCDNSRTIPADVKRSTESGVTTYVATVVCDNQNFTYTKKVQDEYSLEVVDGKIKGHEGTTGSYVYQDMVTVVADEMKDGKYFSGWYVDDTLLSEKQVYTFAIIGDMTLTAKYENEEASAENAVVSLRMSERDDIIGTNKEKVTMTVEWSVPSNCTMVGAGLVRSYTVSNKESLVLEEVDGSIIRKNVTSADSKNGLYELTVNMSATTKVNPVFARGYLKYSDDEGKVYTIYTDVVTSSPKI